MKGKAKEDGDPKQNFLRRPRRRLGTWSGVACLAAAGAAELLGVGHGLREAAEIVAISGGAVAVPGVIGIARDKILPADEADSVEATVRDLVEQTQAGTLTWKPIGTFHSFAIDGKNMADETMPWGKVWQARLANGTIVEFAQSAFPPFNRGLGIKPAGAERYTIYTRPREVISEGYSAIAAEKRTRERGADLSSKEEKLSAVRNQLQSQSKAGGLRGLS